MAISINPKVVSFHKVKSDIFFAFGNIEDAIKSVQCAITLAESNFTKAHMIAQLCGFLIKIPQYELAVANMHNAVNLMPDDGYFKFRLSVLYFQITDNDSAILFARQALELDPENEVYLRHYSDLMML